MNWALKDVESLLLGRVIIDGENKTCLNDLMLILFIATVRARIGDGFHFLNWLRGNMQAENRVVQSQFGILFPHLLSIQTPVMPMICYT